jgi:hypothetical protein
MLTEHFEQFRNSADEIGLSVAAAHVPQSKFEHLELSRLEGACDLRVRQVWKESSYAKREDKLEWLSVGGPLLIGAFIDLVTSSGGAVGVLSIFVIVALSVRDYRSTKRRLDEVSSMAYQIAIAELERRQKAEAVERERQMKKTVAANLKIRLSRSSAKAPMPSPIPRGVTPRGAEELCARWMSYLGAIHAKVTQYASDGGIDVEATDYIAQVKNYTRTVGVAAVREFSGVAKVDGRMGLFFTSGNYAAGAIDFADKADIALFRYSAEQGELYAANFKAEGMLERGLI